MVFSSSMLKSMPFSFWSMSGFLSSTSHFFAGIIARIPKQKHIPARLNIDIMTMPVTVPPAVLEGGDEGVGGNGGGFGGGDGGENGEFAYSHIPNDVLDEFCGMHVYPAQQSFVCDSRYSIISNSLKSVNFMFLLLVRMAIPFMMFREALKMLSKKLFDVRDANDPVTN